MKKRDRYLYVNIGTHVRGAMVFENMVIDYAEINCEFGNMLISAGSEPKRRIAEEISAESLLEKADVEHVADFIAKVESGDAYCNQLLDEYITSLSVFLHNMHVIYGWDIIIGGRMSKLISKYKYRIDEAISNLNEFREHIGSVFTVSKHGEYSAVMGAAMLPIDRFF